MSEQKSVDTNVLYNETDLLLLNHTSSILKKMVSVYDNDDVLAGMSIDKTDSVLRILAAVDNSVNKRAGLALRLMALQDTNDDRERLLDILSNQNIRRASIDRRNNPIEIEEAQVLDANVDMVRGELDMGIEQLSLELLALDNNDEGDE